MIYTLISNRNPSTIYETNWEGLYQWDLRTCNLNNKYIIIWDAEATTVNDNESYKTNLANFCAHQLKLHLESTEAGGEAVSVAFFFYAIITNRVTLYNNNCYCSTQRWVDTYAVSGSHCIWNFLFLLFVEATMKAIVAEHTNSVTWQLMFTTVGLVFSTLLISWSNWLFRPESFPTCFSLPKSCCWLK